MLQQIQKFLIIISFFGCQPSILVNAGNTKIFSEMAAVNILDGWIVGRARINKRMEPKSCKLQVFSAMLKILNLTTF